MSTVEQKTEEHAAIEAANEKDTRVVSTVYRPGTLADSRAVFDVRMQSLGIDLTYDPAWDDYLAQTAELFWVAERDGQVIGYARSILHDGVRELTEYFVHPSSQSAGVGRELLVRAFPATGARHRIILASRDMRAQARYLKSGVYPGFSVTGFTRKPEAVSVATDLTIAPVTATRDTLAIIGAIDMELLEFTRDTVHEFLLHNRQGYLYYRSAQVVGYGYVGRLARGSLIGPFALLDECDVPAVLTHAETEAARRGADAITLYVPLINRVAVSHLLARGFRLDETYGLFMSDEPFGKFENYIICNPPFFL
jgi:ribosomal protein S18 acetylase RimI-like enzyme